MDSHAEPTLIGNGRYALDRRIGAGGGGAVYLAHDQVLNRWVAIKRLHADATSPHPTSAYEEATRLASLQHPNIVTIHDFFLSDEEVFVVMEYVQGQNLEDLKEALPIDVFLDIARQCLEALGTAHNLGMVHRDIKPGNIMLTRLPSGGFQVKLLDFGLAKVMAEPTLQTIDHEGGLLGSILMMSPEQLSRQPIDHRCDLYALGCVFYQALANAPAFRGSNVPELIAAHLQHDFIPLAQLRPDLPSWLTIWVERLFSYDRNDRPQNAEEALEEMRNAQIPTSPIHSTHPKTISARIAPIQPTIQTSPISVPSQPFYKTTLFAVGATIAIIGALFTVYQLGWIEIATAPKNEIPPVKVRDTFTAEERGAISEMLGKRITVTGTIAKFGEEGAKRFLTFQGSHSKDVMVFFDTTKAEFPKFRLVKFPGKTIRATGQVIQADGRLLLELASMEDIKTLDTEKALGN